jgi:Kef-type K+ transport system membrane component KefB
MDLHHIWTAVGHRIAGPAVAYLVLTLAIIIGPKLAEKLRLPAMVGLVLVGMAVGPHGFRLIDTHDIALSALGTFGLLYLMFSAGLELDLKLLSRLRRAALTFAVLSFVIPFTLGLVSAKLIGYAWAAAILMGSNWGSHTLVTYPMLRQMGLSRIAPVGTVVGATAVTDTSALLVLAGVSASVKKAGGFGVQSLEIVIGLAALGVWTMWALPRIARWFFARVGTERGYRLVFGISAFLSGAVLAELAGIDGIVGAFFAGLGLNRAIPERSDLMDRLQFTGSALFIPIFLISVGVLLEPKVLIDPKTLLIALLFTVAVLGGKALAAVIAGRRFHFSWPEVGVMAGLSGSQAAATLATTLVGAKLGLFDTRTINAVLVVILASLVVTPGLVTFFGKRIKREEGAGEALGSVVLVLAWGESTRELLPVAARLAAPDGGIVTAATIAEDNASETQLAAQQHLRDQAEEWLARDGLEARSIFRVSRSRAAGLWQTLRSEKASLLMSEWHFEGLDPNTEQSALMMRSPVPIVLVHGAIEPFERLVVLASADGARDLEVASELAARIAGTRPVTFVGKTPPAASKCAHIATDDPLGWARDQAKPGDLLVLTGLESARQALARFPTLADARFLVAIAPHAEPEVREQPTLVVGRSLTAHPAT